MMILGILLFGATLYSCKATNNTEQVFYMEIIAPEPGNEFLQTMAGTRSSLKNTTGVTLKQAFKVVGEPRILAIISVTRVLCLRSLEVKLASLKLSITVKELYDPLDLATDLNVSRDIVTQAKAKRLEALTGDHIYFAKSNLITQDLDNVAIQTVLRTNVEKGLAIQSAGVKLISYNVLGEFPMQFVNFVSLAAREIQKTLWEKEHRNIFAASSMTRVVQLEDYLKENYCG